MKPTWRDGVSSFQVGNSGRSFFVLTIAFINYQTGDGMGNEEVDHLLNCPVVQLVAANPNPCGAGKLDHKTETAGKSARHGPRNGCWCCPVSLTVI